MAHDYKTCVNSLKHLAHIVVNTYVTATGEQITDEFDDYRCLSCGEQIRIKAKPTHRKSFRPVDRAAQGNKLGE